MTIESRELETERLILRPWRKQDLGPFAQLNADVQVMEHFVAPLTREQSDAFAEKCRAGILERGYGLWAVELRAGIPFIGFVGLAPLDREVTKAAGLPPGSVEVGWRLARASWGRGLASEAAGRALAFGFAELEVSEIVSLTAVRNRRSRAVMERIGLTRLGWEFDHPRVPVGHPVRRHCLYRISKIEWESLGSSPV